MHFLTVLAVVLGSAAFIFVASRISSWTVCEITIPLAGGATQDQVRAAMERMGCLMAEASENVSTGFISGDGFNWGQKLTVTVERDLLRVRSRFSGSQAFGAEKNQENVERFRIEWERRGSVEAVAEDPEIRKASVERARQVAQRARWGGGLAVSVGLILLFIALARSTEGAPASGTFRLAALALVPLLYGLPRLLAGASRLRKKTGG